MPHLLGRLIGVGSERFCYLDAEDNNKCIKISKKSKSRQTRREIQYFEYLAKRNDEFSFLPKYYGYFESECYIGYIQECFLEKEQGGIYDSVVPIGVYVSRKENDYLKIKNILKILKEEMLLQNILCCDLSTSNILVVRKNDSERLVIVDGIGCTEYIPICKYIKWFGRKKINRQWVKFEQRLNPWFNLRINGDSTF